KAPAEPRPAAGASAQARKHRPARQGLVIRDAAPVNNRGLVTMTLLSKQPSQYNGLADLLERALKQAGPPATQRIRCMPKVSEIFGGSYLKADHLNGQSRVVTITAWNKEIVYGDEAHVLHFAEETRALKLSATSARDIAAALKMDDMENWIGEKIEL